MHIVVFMAFFAELTHCTDLPVYIKSSLYFYCPGCTIVALQHYNPLKKICFLIDIYGRTFYIHVNVPLHKRFFIVGKGSLDD